MYNSPWNKFPMPSFVGHPEGIAGDFSSPAPNIPNDIPFTNNAGVPQEITVDPVDIQKVTEIVVDGNGVFDRFMQAVRHQLQREYEEDKIDKSEFMQAYIGVIPEMMAQAVNYVKIMADAELTAQQIAELRAKGAEERANLREQSRKLEMEAYYTMQSAREKEVQVELAGVQVEELKANGASERKLKESQIQVQEQQAALYERQRIGFDDKRKIDTLKAVFDMYAIHATEVNSNVQSSAIPALHGLSMSSVIVDALSDVDVGIRYDAGSWDPNDPNHSQSGVNYYQGDVGYGYGGDQIANNSIVV